MTNSIPRILLQLDTDPHASSFDAVVAVDAGVQQLLQYGDISSKNVTSLIHGAMFTRGEDALRRTAIFVGGTNVSSGEALLEKILNTFFGPVRVSVMLDSNGCNTTAAAAVLSASRHLSLSETTAIVLGGTGPVGERVVRLLAGQGASVRVGSRSLDRAQATAQSLQDQFPTVDLTGIATSNTDSTKNAIQGCDAVFSCGAAGVQMLSADTLSSSAAAGLRLVIDLNAVPPLGIEGVKNTDKGKPLNGLVAYGALGVGGLKMQIHRAALKSLFETNDQVLNAEEIYAIGLKMTVA